MAFFNSPLGVDLGTVNVLIWKKGRIVLQEPTLVALHAEPDERGNVEIVEIGQPAREMLGRVDEEDLEIVRPLVNGVIADYEVTQALLEYFLGRIAGRTAFFKPDVMISVPWGVTNVERRAVYEASLAAGARKAYLIHEPLAAAVGAGLPVNTPAGDMIVNIGGGITEAAILTMNHIVRASSGRVGGLHMDEAIANHIRKKYNLVVGQPSAEALKVQIGAAHGEEEALSTEIQGIDHVSGLPRNLLVTTAEVVEALEEPLMQIVEIVKSLLINTPPELASDIMGRGILLTGGGAMLRGIDTYLTNELRVPVFRADNPLSAVAIGAGRAITEPVLMRSISQTV